MVSKRIFEAPMNTHTLVSGILIDGHGIASGRNKNSPYPSGSVAMQAPFFAAGGLDLSACYMGTLNVSIAPNTWTLLHAQHRFEHLEWTHLHPPETFSFMPCSLRSTQGSAWVNAWIYYPHPETKKMHFQGNHIMEIIAPKLPECTIGKHIALRFSALDVGLGPTDARLTPNIAA